MSRGQPIIAPAAAATADAEVVADFLEARREELARGDAVPWKPATPDDATTRTRDGDRDQLLEAWGSEHGTAGWRRDWLARPEPGGPCIGVAGLAAGPFAAERHRANYSIVLDPAWRGRGLGRRLTTAVLEAADAVPAIEWVDLLVFESNAAGIAIYRDAGFVQVGRVEDRFRLRGASVAELTMVRSALG